MTTTPTPSISSAIGILLTPPNLDPLRLVLCSEALNCEDETAAEQYRKINFLLQPSPDTLAIDCLNLLRSTRIA
jgi:hypothetical protein